MRAGVEQDDGPVGLLLPATTAPAPHDAELLAALAAGSIAAFDALYRRHEARVYQYLTGMLGSQAIAQPDAVFARTWQTVVSARQRFEATGCTAASWLYGLAHQHALDALATTTGPDDTPPQRLPERLTTPTGLPWEQWPVPTQAGDPGEASFWSRSGQRLLACLEALPATSRSAFLLHHGAGLSLAELAGALGGTIEEAEHRLHGAVQALRAGMGAYEAPQRH